MRVLEVDQWAVSGTEGKPFKDYKRDSITDGDAGAVLRMGIGHEYFRDVSDDDSPSIGTAWFINEKGVCHLWKANFDSSD